MKATIVGAINFDRITPYQSTEERTSFGGVLYNAIALAGLLGEKDRIVIVSRMGENHRAEVNGLLEPYPAVDASHISTSPRGTNENIIRNIAKDDRTEILKANIEPLDAADVELHLDSDLFVFNFIAGYEITQRAVRLARERSKGLVSLDVHNKIQGIAEDGTRFLAGWPDWREWLSAVHVVQMNEKEISSLVERELRSVPDYVGAAGEILDAGPEVVLVTLGGQGALVAHDPGGDKGGGRKDGGCRWASVGATSHEYVDPTGCGDCFAAGFLYSYLEDGSPVLALAFASTVAGNNVEHRGFAPRRPVGELVARMEEEYPEVVKKARGGWAGEAMSA